MIRLTLETPRSRRPGRRLFASLLLCAGLVAGPWAAAAQEPPGTVDAGPSREGGSRKATAPLPLEWSPEPGVFELALARRDANPLYLPDRRVISGRKLRDAKVRDAKGAWQVLDAYVDLASRRSRMARLDSAERMSKAIAEIDALIKQAMRVGGTVYRIADSLASMRAQLIAGWRRAASGNPARLAPLDRLQKKKKKPSTGSAARFLAQLGRDQGPIPDNEVVPALLGEDPGTISRVMKRLPAARQRALRRNASMVYADLEREGVETRELEPKLDAMGATF